MLTLQTQKQTQKRETSRGPYIKRRREISRKKHVITAVNGDRKGFSCDDTHIYRFVSVGNLHGFDQVNETACVQPLESTVSVNVSTKG
eukprot:Pgem_evm1s4894